MVTPNLVYHLSTFKIKEGTCQSPRQVLLTQLSVSKVMLANETIGELRILARKEPVKYLTQKAESDRSRLSALKP